MDKAQYKIYARQYSRVKAGEIQCVYAWVSELGLLGIATDFSKSIIINYSKRKLAANLY